MFLVRNKDGKERAMKVLSLDGIVPGEIKSAQLLSKLDLFFIIPYEFHLFS